MWGRESPSHLCFLSSILYTSAPPYSGLQPAESAISLKGLFDRFLFSPLMNDTSTLIVILGRKNAKKPWQGLTSQNRLEALTQHLVWLLASCLWNSAITTHCTAAGAKVAVGKRILGVLNMRILYLVYLLELGLFCGYIANILWCHISHLLGRPGYIAIHRTHLAHFYELRINFQLCCGTSQFAV